MTARRPVVMAAAWLAALVSPPIAPGQPAGVPEPAVVLGFEPGADFELAPWADVVEYVRAVGASSARVRVDTLGESTQGRPFVVAAISSEETIADLDRYKDMQRRLSHPDPDASPEEVAELVGRSKTTVLITCTIHSSETASTLMACALLHDLATGDTPEIRAILDETIVLLVPSVNPDGVDIVHDWYERSKGTPWEGSGMPRLYHPYAGHDTNRDWFMLNLDETRLLTRLLYEEWFPTITWDVHQMGSNGPRLFVPPFHDPVNPNLDPRISQGIFLIGAHLAADLAREGKKGVATHVMYDNWWNGGNRTVPQRHNMVGILTEAASVKLASPIFLDRGDLRGGGRGFDDHEAKVTFVDPWPGGWWRIGDIVAYELTSARALLTLASRYKDWFQSNYRAVALDQIRHGIDRPPFAWIVPADQRDPGSAARLVEILVASGIEARRATEDFQAGGVSFPAGSWIFPAAQPYRPHLKDMMERQEYPRRVGPDGRPERPYDVAGWTLPLQMGVKSAAVAEPFDAPSEPVESVDLGGGRIEGDLASADAIYLRNRANDDVTVALALLDAGIAVERLAGPATFDGLELPQGALRVPVSDEARALLESILPTVSAVALAVDEPEPTPEPGGSAEEDPNHYPPAMEDEDGPMPRRFALSMPQIGLYQPWVPSMDEGWTRLVFEEFRIPYETLHNAAILAGDLDERFDVIVLPSVGRRTMLDGYGPDETEPAYVGGLAGVGVEAIRRFVQDGGRLVCLEESAAFAIEALGLPVRDVLDGISPNDFYCPGSILSVRYDDESYLAVGMPQDGSAYFSSSMGFEPTGEGADSVRVACRYAPTNLLESGWLLGPEHLQGKAAVVEVSVGDGQVVLFGFPPQHRGQPHATFRPLFNALLGPGSPVED
ncbi:M14 family metallopeptidase [Tautonia plasticadhaerens]|uniref:Zinc carboxypeptidase n=1 Tax=Tautonia plasticadhaerens TaxID=2527974 RepID=A0A518H8I3_9BACT|nr:M14 family zinc carboxypeptidase [Tautonia plasticadhaerens]QDV37076.1 Zinc carboxypeptidase [Tautonia plasticadhaerens]